MIASLPLFLVFLAQCAGLALAWVLLCVIFGPLIEGLAEWWGGRVDRWWAGREGR